MVNKVTVVRQLKDAYTVVAEDMETNLITLRGRQNAQHGIRSVSDARRKGILVGSAENRRSLR